jgi:UDP-glucose 4-epimerase
MIGEDPGGIPNNLVPYISLVAIGTLPKLNVYGNDYPTPDGTGVRDYIHILDLAEGHLSALNYLADHSGWIAINLGTGRGVSVLEMLKEYELASEKKIYYSIEKRRIGDIACCFAKVNRAKQVLNWEASRSIRDMCLTGWLWQQYRRTHL